MRILAVVICLIASGAIAGGAGTGQGESAQITRAGGSGGGGGGTVTDVTGTAPIVSSGGTTPAISCTTATTSTAGCVSASAQSFSGLKTLLDGLTVNSSSPVTFNNNISAAGLSTVLIKAPLSGDTGAGITFDGTANAAGKKWSIFTVNSSGSFGLFDLTRSVYAFFCLDGTSPTCAIGPGANTAASTSWGTSAVASIRVTDSTGAADYASVTSAGLEIGGGERVSLMKRATATVDFASMTASCVDSADITVTGAVVGAECIAGQPDQSAVVTFSVSCYVRATNNVRLRACAPGTGIDPASATYSVRIFNP
jgi:hypothetical protein